MVTALLAVVAFAGGWFLWTFWEYVLHRWAFHEMRGIGFPSRAHLDHHARSGWYFDPVILPAWAGVVLAGWGWKRLGDVVGLPVGLAWALGAGWVVGYFFYEWHHRAAHLYAPHNRWQRWLRKSHFHHHFGHPMRNHGVTVPLWDKVFRTEDRPEVIRVPRRMALPWLVDESGEVLPEYAEDYVLVGTATLDDRVRALDKARAYANLEPTA